jgi:hypothetical protein
MKTCPGQVPIGPNLATHKRKFGIGFTQIMTSIKIEELFPQVRHINYMLKEGQSKNHFSPWVIIELNLWLKLFLGIPATTSQLKKKFDIKS